MKLLRLHSWFLESLERRLGTCRRDAPRAPGDRPPTRPRYVSQGEDGGRVRRVSRRGPWSSDVHVSDVDRARRDAALGRRLGGAV